MGAKLQPVLDAITELHRIGVWLELTTLIVPDLNDSDEELRDIAAWIAGIDTSILWHISRFYPQYKMTDRPPTPVAAIHRAVQIGREAGLQYVYAGNVPGNEYESTRCPQCSTVVIRRYGYDTHSYLKGDRCPSCGYRLAMIV
jgi:pyruvate formate lyase activating enzyme